MREMMQQMPLGIFVVMVAFPLAMTGLLAFAAVRARRSAAAVESAKPEPIGMATDGYRRFEGKAEAIGSEALRAPLTGADCVWYEARLERWRPSRSDQESHWTTVRSIQSSAPFLVRDGTGACLVDTWIGEITPTDKSRWTGALPEPVDRLPPRLGPTQSFSEGLEISGGSNKYRYTESRIYPGDALLVVGQFTNGRFAATDDDEDDDEDDGDTLVGADGVEDDPSDDDAGYDDGGARRWTAYDEERTETLHKIGRSATRAWITHGGKAHPLIVANATAATHVAMNEMGAQAALYVALVPLGIAALMLLARFG